MKVDLLGAATYYALRGVPVFPLRPGTKEPMTSHGFEDATTDPARIRSWWRRTPGANIAARTGAASGLVVVDVDNGDDKDGFASLEAWEHAYGRLPATATTRTPGGGVHLFFKVPPTTRTRSGGDVLGPDVDVRADGGYVLLPPSVIPGKGAYTPLDEARTIASLEDVPAALVEALAGTGGHVGGYRGGRVGSPSRLGVAGGTIPNGVRNESLTSIAGSLHDGSRSYDRLVEALAEINVRRCTPPLPRGEIEKIARSIEKKAPCRKSAPQPTPEARQVVEKVAAAFFACAHWPGGRGKTAHDVMRALIETAEAYGEAIPCGGARASIGIRALGQKANVGSMNTTRAALWWLRARGWIRFDHANRRPNEAGAYVLMPPRKGDAPHPLRGSVVEGDVSSASGLRAPYLRYSGPDPDHPDVMVRRLGKAKGRAVFDLEAHGPGTREEISARLGYARPRDTERRILEPLVWDGVVELIGGAYRLTENWHDAIDQRRAHDKEPEAMSAQIGRDKKAQQNYREYLASVTPGTGLVKGLQPDETGLRFSSFAVYRPDEQSYREGPLTHDHVVGLRRVASSANRRGHGRHDNPGRRFTTS